MQEKLQYGQWYWLRDAKKSYILVKEGLAELYIVHRKTETDISRRFLAEVGPGEFIPREVEAGELGLLLIATKETVIRQISALELEQEGGYQPALENLSELLVGYAEAFKGEELEYKKRLGMKQIRRDILRRGAYSSLINKVLSRLDDFVEADVVNERPVITALKFIAVHMGISRRRITVFQEKYLQENDDERIINDIIRSTELFGRQVHLEEGWEISDQGPLLIFKGGLPMACLPIGPNAYELYDIGLGKRYLVTKEILSDIEEKAYLFFRRMPEDIDSISKWFKWAFKLCWDKDYEILLFSCLLLGILPLAAPLITQTVFEDIIPAYDRQALVMVIQVMLVTALATSVITLMRSVSLMRMKYIIRSTAEPALWIKLLGLPIDFFRQYNIGSLSSRMQGIASISAKFSSAIANGILNGIFGILNLILMFYYSPRLALVGTIIWGLFACLSLGLSYWLRKNEQKRVVADTEVSGLLLQLIGGLNKFRLRGAEARAFYMWSEKFGLAWEWKRKATWKQSILNLLSIAQPLVLNFFIYYFTMHFFDEAQKGGISAMSTADFLSFYAAMGSFGAAVSGFLLGCTGLMDMGTSLELIKPILVSKDENGFQKPMAGELKGNIDLTEVSFRYRPELPYALRNINLHIPAGSFVALVGSSGCGKSTLVRLLLGLERPERGLIQYDGLDLNSIDIASVRRQMGVVMQQGRIMAGSILSNIIGSLPLTVEDAWEVAEKVGLAEDIRQMPMGMYTIISENGTNISGGQRQRILVARALVAKAKIIIFDEATRAMDNITQGIVAKTMDNLKATRIVVAHRLSTIKSADIIVLLDKGIVADIGTFTELRDRNKLFSELIKRQEI